MGGPCKQSLSHSFTLQVDTGNESYKGTVVKCDRYDDKDFKRTDLSSTAMRTDFAKVK